MSLSRIYNAFKTPLRLPGAPRLATDMAPRFERLLLENWIPFWYPAVIDRRAGGYRLCHQDGEWRDPPHRHIVSQSRTLWYFARLAGSPYGGAADLEAARHGFDFLVEKMWDEKYGGVYWAVDDSGTPVLQPQRDDHRTDIKHMLGQSFALYGISEYARVSGDATAREYAERLYGLIDEKARDRHFGGLAETLSRDWSAAPDGVRDAHHTGLPTDRGFGVMSHTLEALRPYIALTGDERARHLLVELMTAMLASLTIGVPYGHIAGLLRRDWIPRGRAKGPIITYGHDLELAMFFLEACRALDFPLPIMTGRLRRTVGMAMRGGFDRKRGGFFADGRPWFRAMDRSKIDWVQAEGLLICLWCHLVTGDEVAAYAANRTLDWIENNQVDWRGGGWHFKIMPDGRPTGAKADDWHSPYHVGRALLNGLELLKDATPTPETPGHGRA